MASSIRDSRCGHCKMPYADYMVRSETWRVEAGLPFRLFLCLECLESVLGRSLALEDFKMGVPVNDAIFFGTALWGRHKSEKKMWWKAWLDRHPPR